MDSDDFGEFWWILIDSDGSWWILMDFDGFWWILSPKGLRWVLGGTPAACLIVIVQYLWTMDGSNNRRRIIGDSYTRGGVVLLVAVDVRSCVCSFNFLWLYGFWWILMNSDGFWWILMEWPKSKKSTFFYFRFQNNHWHFCQMVKHILSNVVKISGILSKFR